MKKRKVKVDGEEYEVELEKQNGLWNVTIEGKSFNIEIEGSSVGDTSVSKRKKTNRGKKSGTISSTIPGKVVSISAKEGQMVSEGDVVMILEAMKMQNEIKSPIDGIVKEINCTPGERVEGNVTLVRIDRDSGSDRDGEV